VWLRPPASTRSTITSTAWPKTTCGRGDCAAFGSRCVDDALGRLKPLLKLVWETLLNELVAHYDANRLTVTRQLPYDPESNKTIDLCLFLNGIPVATAELKNHLTGQNIEHAIEQYRTDRDPKNVTLGRRALVHFAVDPDAVLLVSRCGQSGPEPDVIKAARLLGGLVPAVGYPSVARVAGAVDLREARRHFGIEQIARFAEGGKAVGEGHDDGAVAAEYEKSSRIG